VRPHTFMFPLYIAHMQGRYERGEDGARWLTLSLEDDAVLHIESAAQAEGWNARATLRRADAELSASGHADHADRFLAEAIALAALSVCHSLPKLPGQLRQVLASSYRVITRD
jgi:hypothetical protein